MKKTLLLFLAIIAISFVQAQKAFEGTIQYKITYKNLPDEMAGMESMLPQGTSVTMSKNMTRLDQDLGVSGEMIVISNNKTGERTIYIDAGMQKLKAQLTKEEAEKMTDQEPEVSIEYFDDETLDILGYTAKKAILTTKTKVGNTTTETQTTVYYTEKIANPKGDERFEALKGLPLYYELEAQGMTVVTQAAEITKGISDADFAELEGFQEITFEQFQEMMQMAAGGAGGM